MYYVYYGYASPDNYDASEEPVYRLKVLETKEQVLKLYKEQKEETENNMETSNEIFRVIEGEEKQIIPIEKVTEYKLS